VLVGCVRSLLPGKQRQWSQELRLASRNASAVEWLMGLYYYRAEESSDYFFSAPRLNPLPINDYSSTTDEIAYAVFGDTRVALGEQWRLSAGVRSGSEKQRTSDVGTGIRDNPTLTSAQDHWSNTAWRLSVDYEPNRSMLVYASLSTGFTSGGITTERLPSGAFQQFDPEHLLAYEAGVKAQSSQGGWRVSAAAFLYDFDDMQVATTRISADQLIYAVDNAARAEIYGLDAAATVTISERLVLDVGLVWLPKREFVEYESVVTSEDLAGNLLSRAPEWSSSAAIRYAWPLSDLGELSANLQYNHRSHFYFSKENLDSQSQSGFGVWNLSLRLEAPHGRWYVFASGHNLANQDYFNQALIQSSPGYPDTYEAGIGLKF
jgi:iron complex outermembrane receptor protein